MRKLNIVKKLSVTENILCVYRNYAFLDESWRRLVQIRIFIESCITVAASIYIVASGLDGFSLSELDNVTYIFTLSYVWFSAVNALAAIISSYYSSNTFKDFVSHVNAVYDMYENVGTHKMFIKKRRRRFYLDVILFAFIMILSTSTYIYDSLFVVPSVMIVILFVYEMSLQYRFYYENFVFFEYIEIIVVPLKFLNESISVVVENLSSEQDEMVNDRYMREIRKELERWARASQLLVTASDNLRECFGVQIAISFCSVIIYYITLLYQGVTFMINSKLLTTSSMRSTMFEFISYVLMKALIVTAGQRAQNEAEHLYRNLCALHNLLVGCAEATGCARAAAGLARRLRAAPLRVRLLSSLAVQMALLADILALVANYTIVLLQFNHIV